MLRYLLKWEVYRTLKSGLLLDFFTKRIFFNVSQFFFYYFSIFFGDKFILEHLFSNFFNFLKLVSNKLKTTSKASFLNFFKVTIHVLLYISLVATVIYILH